MNFTNTALTTKADVVGKEPGPNKDVQDLPQDLKEPKEEAKSPISDESSDSIELDQLSRNEPLVDQRDRPEKESSENYVATTKYSTSKIPLLELDVTTTNSWEQTDSEPDSDTEDDSLHVVNNKAIKKSKERDTDILISLTNYKINNNQKDDINEKSSADNKQDQVTSKPSSRSTSAISSTSSNNKNSNSDKQFDLVSIKFTTIFLRLFAPDSTTTAEPKLGYVQQELPGQSLEPGDVQFQENPLVDKPQTLDVERKYNATSSTTVIPPISASSSSTPRHTTYSIQQKAPATPSSTTPAQQQEVPTNATILVVKEEVRRVSSSGTGVKSPLSPETDAPPATTAQSGVTAGTLLAVIIPILIVILLIIFIVFVFVRRRKQFHKKRTRLRVDKEDVEEQIELNTKPEDPKNMSTEKLYAKVDKSRKSRISTSDETTPLTTALINEIASPAPHNEDMKSAFSPVADDLDFVDNDLYERDSDGDKNSNPDPLTVTNYPNYPEDDETYEIPEDVVNQLEHDSNDQLAPPVPFRTNSSPRNSAYFAATPPVPHRHSSLALTSMTPPLPPRHSSLLSTPRRPESKSFEMLELDRDQTPKLPPRHSLRLPVKAKSASPENKRATFAGHFVPMPLSNRKPIETSSESDSSSESDFEELPPPREHAPPLPEGAEVALTNGGATCMIPDADESEYLEPVNLKANGSSETGENHDYDPVYIPSNPVASHIAHLVDNTNYLKGARNRSPSKASINPYEEIQFGTDVYADVDESTMTSPPVQSSTPAPPRLTPRSSRLSDLVTPPQLSPRSPNSNATTPLTSRPTSGTSDATPQLPPRSPTKTNNELTFNLQNGSLNLPKEPRYSGLLLDSEDELDAHDYTPLDYEENDVNNDTNGHNVENEEFANIANSNSNIKGSNTPRAVSTDSVNMEGTQNDYNYDTVPTENNSDEIYEPIEGADKDGIYEAIEFGDEE